MAFKPRGVSSAPTQASAPIQPQGGHDKWKLSSQLQKAIRHGRRDEAVRAAQDLLAIEPSYLRYRLAVIAMEDVGAGSPTDVLETLGPGWKKAEVEARGGDRVVLDTVERFVAAVKDRTPCDLMYATRFVPEFEAEHGPWSALAWARAHDLAMDAGNPWWARALGAWRCAGTDKFQARTEILPRIAGDWDRWVAANGEAFGQDAATLMRIGEFQREHHHVFMGLALGANQQADAITIAGSVPDLPKLGYWLSAAIDKHTADGKRALTLLPDINPAGAQTLAGYGLGREAQMDLIGRLWFWKEGSECDIKRDHALARAIHPDNQAKVLGNVPRGALEQAFGDPLLWQAARAKALGMSPGPNRNFRRG